MTALSSPLKPLNTVALVGKPLPDLGWSGAAAAPQYPRAQIELLQRVADCVLKTGRALRVVDLEFGFANRWQAAFSSRLAAPLIPLAEVASSCDVAIVVGGDGTMLSVGRRLAPSGVPLIGINQGRLGFITDISPSEFERVLPNILSGAYTQDLRPLITAQLLRGGQLIGEGMALNDVVINRAANAGMIEVRVQVDGLPMTAMRSDGLIIASSTGSTAYALSVGGPLMPPSVNAWVMAPIAPHSLSNRPMIVSSDARLEIELISGRGLAVSSASVNFDSQSIANLQSGDVIAVQKSTHSVTLLHPVGWSYYETLRQKLHWNEGYTP